MRRPFLALWFATTLLPAEGIYFEPNRGQTAVEVQFLARARHAAAFVTRDTLALAPAGAIGSKPVEIRLAGATGLHWQALDRSPGTTSYELGRRETWVKDVPHFRRIAARGVYPGIDWILYGTQGRLEYDLVIAPGADPSAIELEFANIDRIERSSNGELILHTPAGPLTHKIPVSYQETPRGRTPIRAAYRITARNRARFDIGGYDRSLPLVIDPVIESATWLGGEGAETVAAIGPGGQWIAGSTTSVTFPWPPGQRRGIDAFWYDRNSQQMRVRGGSGDDIVTFAAGSIIAGYTNSRDLAVTSRYPWKTEFGGGDWDGFIFLLEQAYYVGGSGDDRILGGSSDGSALVGATDSTDFPTLFPWQARNGGGADGFVLGLSFDSVNFSSYFGGPGNDRALTVQAVGSDPGFYYIGGETESAAWLSPGLSGRSGGFVARLDMRDGTSKVGASLLFEREDTVSVSSLCLASDRTLAIGGSTLAAEQPARVFVAKTTADLSRTLWSRRLAGTGVLAALACTPNGDVAAGGWTSSADFPVTASDSTYAGGESDGFLALWDARGSPVFATLYGGAGSDRISAIAISEGSLEVAGTSDSAEIPLVDALQPGNAGDVDIFRFSVTHRWISAPRETVTGRNLTAPIAARLNGVEEAGVALTARSMDPSRVRVSAASFESGQSSVSIPFGEPQARGGRTIWAECLVAEGEVTILLSAPGYEEVETVVRCVPPVIVTSGQYVGGILTDIRLRMAAADPGGGSPVAQRIRPGAAPVRVQISGQPPSAAIGLPREVILDPVALEGTPLSFSLAGPAPVEISLTSPEGIRFIPSDRLTVGHGVRTALVAPLLAAGLWADLQFEGPVGKVTLRSNDPTRVRLTTARDRAGSESLTVENDAPPRGTPVYLEAIAPGPYSITAEFEGRPPLTMSNYVSEFMIMFTEFKRRGTLARVPAITMVAGTAASSLLSISGFPLSGAAEFELSSLRGTPNRYGRPVRFRLESSSPAVEVPSESFELSPQSQVTFTFGQIRALAPGTATVRIIPEDAAIPVTALPLQVTVVPLAPSELKLGRNLQEQLVPASNGGPVITVTSSDPSKALVSALSTAPGGSVASGPTVWVQARDASGTVGLIFSIPGQPEFRTTVTLVPSGFAWTARTAELSSPDPDANPAPEFAAWRLDPETLEPVAMQSVTPGIRVDEIGIRNSAPGVIALADRPEPLGPAFSPRPAARVRLIPVTRGIARLSIQQPAGFNEPSTGADLEVRSRIATPLIPDSYAGVHLQTRISVQSQTGLTFRSSDPSRLLLSGGGPGAPSPTVTAPGELVLHALAGPAVVKILAFRDGQEAGSGTVHIVPSGFVFSETQALSPPRCRAGGQVSVPLFPAALFPPGPSTIGENLIPQQLGTALGPLIVRAESSDSTIASVVPAVIGPGGAGGTLTIVCRSPGQVRVSIQPPPPFGPFVLGNRTTLPVYVE